MAAGNGHAHITERSKYMTAPGPLVSTGDGHQTHHPTNSSKQEQRARNESVPYLDLELPKDKSVRKSQVEEVNYAIIRR